MRTNFALVLLGAALALSVSASAPAKGFQSVVLIASDGRSIEVRANESAIDGLLSRRGAVQRVRDGYLRLFFVGPGDFPASPARYYPDLRCVALDWPTYETSCGRVDTAVVRLLRPAHTLSRFRARPTVLVRVTYLGTFPGLLKTAAALKSPVELALDRRGRTAPQPRRCFALTGHWRGPAAGLRPRRFLLCPDGVYADRRLYPLRRGVWEWFRLNVGPPPLRAPSSTRSATYPAAGVTCRASDVRRTVVRFVAASNSRKRQALDVLIARDGLFQWFTIDDRDPSRGAGFYKRGHLLRYLAGRRGGANFRLLSFAFNGRGGAYGHFEYRLAVTSRSVRVFYKGKGAVTCNTPHRIAVWSMGNT